MASPTDVTGLQLRLKADDLALADDTAVATWPDTSGASGRNFTMPTGADQPILKTAQLNGKKVVRFAGSGDALNGPAASALFTSQASIFLVVRNWTAGTPFGTTSTGILIRALGGTIFPTTAGASFTATAAASGATLVLNLDFDYAADNYFVRQNGSQTGSGTPALAAPTNDVALGRFANSGSDWFIGDIAEVLVYNKRLTSGERATVHTYIQDEYAITVADYSGAPPDTTAPTAPTGVTATAVGTDISLSWTGSTDNVLVTGYRARMDGGAWVTPVTSPHVFTGASQASRTFEVQAFDAAGNFSTSGSTTFTYVTPVDPLVDPAKVKRGAQDVSRVYVGKVKADAVIHGEDVLLGGRFSTAHPNFGTSTNWTTDGGSALTITQPTAGEVRFVSSAAGSTAIPQCSFATPQSLRGGRFLSFEMKISSPNTTFSNLQTRLTVAGTSRYYSLLEEISNPSSSRTFTDGVWKTVTIAGADLVTSDSTLAELDDVRRLRLLVAPIGGQTLDFSIRNVRINSPRQRPGVVWIFDDARLDTYSFAAPTLAASGFTGTIGVPTAQLGTTLSDGVGVCSLAQLNELEAAGWEMVSHGHNHLSLAGATGPQRLSELQDSYAFLVAQGWDATSARQYIYPSGSYDTGVLALLESEGYHSARGGRRRYGSAPRIDDRYRFGSRFIEGTMETAFATNILDLVAARGGTTVLVFHSLEVTPTQTYNWYRDRFAALVAHAEGLGLVSRKLRDLYPRLEQT